METGVDRSNGRSLGGSRSLSAMLVAVMLAGVALMAAPPAAAADDEWVTILQEGYYRFNVPHTAVLEATGGEVPVTLVAEGNFVDGSTTGHWELGRSGDVWQTTRGPVPPRLYHYRYLATLADGSQVAVRNPDAPPAVTSDPDVHTLFVPGASVAWLSDVSDGGALETLTYDSTLAGEQRSALVWTPPAYDADRDDPYPVLYLQHDAGQGFREWAELGRAAQILDNLAAAGDLAPMVVVMGDGDVTDFSAELLDDLAPAAQDAFNVSADPQDRALAGIGQGADQALGLLGSDAGAVGSVGVISPSRSDVLDGADAQAINDSTQLLRVYVGNTNDPAYNVTYDLLQRLDQAGVDHQFDGVNPGAGAAWETWQESLHDLAPRLFQNVSDTGMSDGHRALTEPHELPAPGTTPTPWLDEHGIVTFETTTEFADADDVVVWANFAPGGSWLLVPMEREGDRWRATVGPLEPGFYYYRIDVDGVAHKDTSNPESITTEPTWSPFFVPGESARLLADVPEGEGGDVEELTYVSNVANQERTAYVWTPPGYDANRAEPYPVFFLQHGGGQSYTDWLEMGRARQILENHHRDGNLADMVVVMGNANVPNATANFPEELRNNIRPAVQDAYNVSDRPEHQALAGLSFGSLHTLNTILQYPGEFAYAGAFSAFLFGTPPGVDADAVNAGTKLLRIYTGDITDFTYPNTMQLLDTLTNLGVEHEFDGVTVGPHGWDTWQQNLIDFAPRLFTPRTKDECKKGGWQEFTAGHGFRNQGQCVSWVARRQ